MIYALLSRNFGVQIYALFPQNILDWGADSANFSSFWMYEDQESKSNGVSLQSRLNPAGCALSSAINAMMDWLLSFQRLQCLSRMVESCSKTRWVSIFTSGSNPRFSSSPDCESWFALVEISWLPHQPIISQASASPGRVLCLAATKYFGANNYHRNLGLLIQCHLLIQ